MQNIVSVPSEWLNFLITFGVLLGAIAYGIWKAHKPPAPRLQDEIPVHAAGFLFDQKSMSDLVTALWSLDQGIREGLERVSECIQAKKDEEHMDLLQQILEKLPEKSSRRPPSR